MTKAALVAVLLAGAARVAAAEPLEDVIRAELAPQLALTNDVGISEVHLSPAQAELDVDRAMVALEAPRELRVGRQSVKLVLRGRHARTLWVPVSFAKLVDVAIAQRAIAAGDTIADGDIAIERRAVGTIAPAPAAAIVGTVVNHDLTAGAIIASRDVTMPPPLARGTQVQVDVQRGAVHVHGTGILEMAARPGQPATARIDATHTLVHGTLVAPATLVIGDAP